jgi:hypothetical protein
VSRDCLLRRFSQVGQFGRITAGLSASRKDAFEHWFCERFQVHGRTYETASIVLTAYKHQPGASPRDTRCDVAHDGRQSL